MPADLPLRACMQMRWDAFRRSHCWVLSGTCTVLDGTVVATEGGQPFDEQARFHLAEMNRRRAELGLPLIIVDEI